MDSLKYSINIIVPIFLIILLGMVSKRKKLIDGNFIKVSSNVVFNIALPASLYLTISQSDFFSIFDFKMVSVAVIVTLISFIVALLLSKLFCKQSSQKGAFVQGAFRGNLAIFGMAVINSALSEEAYAQGAGLLVFLIPLYNLFSILALTEDSHSVDKKSKLLDQSKKLIKNPLIISILAGVISSLINLNIPQILNVSLTYLSKMTLPLALLGIGGTLHLESLKSRLLPTISASLIKLLLVPAIALTIAKVIGIEGESLVVLFILIGSPVALASFAMANALNSDTELTADIITVSTLLSMITIGVGLIIFKSLSII